MPKYYVVSPNVWNDSASFPIFLKHMIEHHVVLVQRTGDVFGNMFKNTHIGDRIIVAQGENKNKRLFFCGEIASESVPEQTAMGLVAQSKKLLYFHELKNEDLHFDASCAYGGSQQCPTIYELKPTSDSARDIINCVDNFIKKEKSKVDLKNLLLNNHNIILHGAPGTGKTYLAKQIAKEMGCTENEIGFVQFHQSYDYTDFVEGLRPVEDEDGNMGFERQDGVFKSFCKEALGENEKHYSNFEEAYKNLVDDASKEGLKLSTLARGKVFKVIVNGKGNLCAVPNTEAQSEMTITKESLQTAIETGKIRDWKPYVTAIEAYLKEKYGLGDVQEDDSSKNKKYVFIIDEINRGEMSKIFGELFFSIDPGYRGEVGRIKTQYQNLVPEGDAFEKGFYVPENVYIIGTMNDIDRSIESMDFAMRRRFAFKEVKASDRIAMLDDLKFGKKDDAIKRMIALNAAIEKVEGLSSAYDIGPAYFLKLDNYGGDFNQLWEYHIEGVLREYLRGMEDAEETLATLHKAYNLENA